MPPTRTRRKRRLGQLLASLRKSARKSEDDFEDLTRKSQATLSRIENGYTLPDWTVLAAMLAFYGATVEERHEAEAMWVDAKQDAKRVEHPMAYNPKARGFARVETDAKSERAIEPLVIPGLLQTIDYAAAVRKAAHRFANPALDDDRFLAARASRAKLLHGPEPIIFHALLDEAVVRRQVGGPTVAAAQLRHLLKIGGQPNVTVQVIPFEAGAYGTMSGGGTVILGYDDEDPDAVYLEYAGGGEWVENEDDVQKFIASFLDVANEVALTPDRSAQLIDHQATYLEGL